MHRWLVTWSVVALMAIGSVNAQEATETPPAPAEADDVVVVEASGEGLTEELALKDALRHALEQGGRVEIFSDSKVENYQLMHDTIIARAKGIVTDFTTLDGYPKKVMGGTYKTMIRARVSKSVLARHWGELQNVLNQVGRPKILVWINERIDDRPQDMSQLESLIEKQLLQSGFDLVARSAMDDIRQKEIADAQAENDSKKLQAIAKRFKAHLFISGSANANAAGLKVVYGEPMAFFNCDLQVKMYYTDTGKLLASEALPNDQHPEARGGVRGTREHSPQAGRKAIANVATPLTDSIYSQVMEQWATAISAGGELVLEVQGLSVKNGFAMKRLLADLQTVENVNSERVEEMTIFRINARLTAEQLAEHLVTDEFEKLIEVENYELNRVQAKAIGE